MSDGGPCAAETLEQQALLSLLQGDYPTAIELYRQTAAAYEEAGRPAGVAHAHLNVSTAHARAGDTEAALEAIDEARARFLALDRAQEVAMCDANRGDLLVQAGDYEGGLALKRQARDALVAEGFLRDAVQCDMGICVAHVQQLELKEGTRAYANARSRALVLKDPALLDMCDQGFEHIVAAAEFLGKPAFALMLCTCGQVLAQRAHFEVAMRLFERARTIFAEIGPATDLASCLMVLGNTLCLLGRPLEGIARFREARALHVQEGSAEGIAGCDQGLGGAYYLLGQPEQALRHYDAALQAFGEDAAKRAPLVKNLGQAYQQMERPDRARELFEEAVALFRELDLEPETAEAELNLATTLLRIDPERATALLKSARAYFESEGLLKEQADCDTALGAFGGPQAIVRHNERARKAYETLGLRREANNCAMNIAAALGLLGRHEEAVQRLREAAEEFAALGMKKEFGECHANLAAELYLESRAAPEASGDLVRETVAHLRLAIEAVEALRGDVFGQENRLALHGRNLHLYELAVLCCLELGEVLGALEFFERAKAKLLAEMVVGSLVPEREDVGDALYERFVNSRARVVQEGLAPDYRLPSAPESGELAALARTPAEEAFREALAAVLEQRPDSAFARGLHSTAGTTLEGQAAFVDLLPDERSCLLEFLSWGADDSLRAFLVTRQRGVELVTFPAGSRRGIGELAANWARVFQPGVDDQAQADFVAAACRGLHVHLFGADAALLREGEKAARPVGPLLDYLGNLLPADRTAPRMFVVPHAALALLPLHAACTPEGKARYLVEDFEVAYAPSARLFALARSRELPPPTRCALLVANPQPKTNPLRHAPAEGKAVGQSLRACGWEVESLQGEHATKRAFLDGDESRKVTGVHAGLYDVLHLAQHGAFDGRSAYLLFANTSDPEEARLHDREVAYLSLHRAHCVVAAACWTAATDPGSIEHGGLGAAFLQAGVGTYVATIFPLSDLGSSELVPRLYDHRFKKGRSWSDALRRAQLAMIQGDIVSRHGAILQHPYHWAAFTVSGRG